jgi:branched-chain amino acid transport system substrate-binding protein
MKPAPRSRLVSLAVAIFVVAALASHAQAADPGVGESEILIGNSITLQGGKNAYGVAAHAGMTLYFNALNAAGGVHGRRITLRTLDDENNSNTAEANARKLVKEGVFLLFGSVEGGPSTAVMKAAAELNVPLFGPMAGPPALRRPAQPMVFPVRAEHREEFRALMTYGQKTGLRRVGFFHADSDGGRAHTKNVELIAKDLGMELVLQLPFRADAGDSDFDRMAKAIAAANPDMIINHGSPSVYQKLIEKSKAAGVRVAFMGVNSGSSQLAKALGPLAQGMVFAQVVPSPWQRKYEISREYQDTARKFRPDAEFSYGGLEGFLTAKALAQALKASGRELSRAGFVKALEASKLDLGGVSARFAPGDHEGSRFVDLSLVSSDGKFLH